MFSRSVSGHALSSGSPHEPQWVNGASEQQAGSPGSAPVSRRCPQTLCSRHTLRRVQERGPGPLNGSKRSRDAEAQTAAKAARPPSPSRVSGWTGDAFVGKTSGTKAPLPRNAARRAELKESQGLESRASLQGFSQPGQTHPLSRSGLGKSTFFPKSPRGRRAARERNTQQLARHAARPRVRPPPGPVSVPAHGPTVSHGPNLRLVLSRLCAPAGPSQPPRPHAKRPLPGPPCLILHALLNRQDPTPGRSSDGSVSVPRPAGGPARRPLDPPEPARHCGRWLGGGAVPGASRLHVLGHRGDSPPRAQRVPRF